MVTEKLGEHLVVYLNGEIDHCCVDGLRRKIEACLRDQSIRRLTMDFSRVSFMDSSGIGMLIGRYKTMTEREGHVFARGMNSSVERIFRMAGLHKIISVHESEVGKDDEK